MIGDIAPDAYRMQPNSLLLPAGTELWRVHGSGRAADVFNPRVADPHFGGSRFDSTAQDPYPFLYTALDPATALAETLLRSTEFDPGTAMRLIPYAAVRGRSLSMLRTRCDLRLISLVSEEDLAAVCQDSWLLEAEGDGRYAKTRRWASELRAQDSGAMGLVWQSRRHRPRLANVLFGDRFAGGEAGPDTGPGRDAGEGGDAGGSRDRNGGGGGDSNGSGGAAVGDTGRFRGGKPPEPVPSAGIPELGSPSGIEELNRLLAPLRAAVVSPWTSP
ncbi:RES family NAD+ phosphorylase [Streptomyces sp. NPDC002073]|uniref:RES family NAD+ phosphorylase n=1 Tax=Streptomyces sp. NBC_00239 TaxID=2903640 RepID=UPI002E27D1B2|nr:RES family NAD+ phosphorylase [Streptomyces sp. NBC_00239]